VINDKVLHCVTFFILTTAFYWILDTTRRRTLNLTLVVCTLVLGIGSEILQGLLPNGRAFDFYDIVANLAGSLAALGLSTWYHTRMLERKRARRYQAVPGDEERDVELGEGVVGAQESGITSVAPEPTLDEQVDNWDENAEDPWDEDDHATGTDEADGRTPSASSAGDVDGERKKRVD
jgi:hypothetical protein